MAEIPGYKMIWDELANPQGSRTYIKCTFRKTDIAPKNRPSQKESSLPTSNHPFSGAMLVSGSVNSMQPALFLKYFLRSKNHRTCHLKLAQGSIDGAPAAVSPSRWRQENCMLTLRNIRRSQDLIWFCSCCSEPVCLIYVEYCWFIVIDLYNYLCFYSNIEYSLNPQQSYFVFFVPLCIPRAGDVKAQ